MLFCNLFIERPSYNVSVYVKPLSEVDRCALNELVHTREWFDTFHSRCWLVKPTLSLVSCFSAPKVLLTRYPTADIVLEIGCLRIVVV